MPMLLASRRRPLVPAFLAFLLLAGCGTKTSPPLPDAGITPPASASTPVPVAVPVPSLSPHHEGGALALAPGDDVLYVADEDHHVLRRAPLPLDLTKVTALPMPGAPAQVLPLARRVLVTIRDPGLLLILEPDPAGALVEVARIGLPADAWGLAVTPDEHTALVTSAWTHRLSAIDLATAKLLWSVDVAREPRAVVVRADGAGAYVTHLVGGAITRVDDLAGTPRVHRVELPPAPARTPSAKTLDASLAYSALLDESGARLFVPRHALGALGQGSWFGATTVDVLATAGDTPVLPRRLPGVPMQRHPLIVKMIDAGLVTNFDISAEDLAPILEPRAAVLRRRTHTLLVAGEGDNRVAELDALSVAPMMRPLAVYQVGQGHDARIGVAASGGAPTGLALSRDESRLYVFGRATCDLAEIELVDPESPPPVTGSTDAGTPAVPARVSSIHLADDLLGKDEAMGRRLFYNATDPVVSGGVACAGCHPDGRDDGHVWHESRVTSQNESERTIFLAEPELAPNEKGGKSGYARQTPMLAGRVGAAGPYGWHAQNADLVARLKDGFGLHRWSSDYPRGEGEQLARIQALRAFIQKGLVPPPREAREPTPEERRGKDIFTSEQAKCARCHAPETDYTDRLPYPFTPHTAPPAGFEDDPKAEFRTPSLRFVGGTAPYFHDGRYVSLEELVDKNDNRMGHTSHLSRDDKAALIAFLRTL